MGNLGFAINYKKATGINIGTAVLTCAGIALLVPRWGTFEASGAYAFSTTIVGLPWGYDNLLQMQPDQDRIKLAVLVESVSYDGDLEEPINSNLD